MSTPHLANTKEIFMFISEYRLAVWVCRNRARFENKRLTPRDSLCLLKNRINLRLQTDYIRLKQMIFERMWVASGLATYDDDMTIRLNY